MFTEEVLINLVFFNQSYLIQPEIIAAFRRVPGVRVIVLDIAPHPDGAQARRAAEILQEHSCGMLLTVNEWGFDSEGILHDYIDSAGLLHINWCVDDPFYEEIILTKKFIPSVRRIDFVSDRDYIAAMHARGYNAHFLPLAVDPQLFSPCGNGFTSDCVFVGNSYLSQIDEFTRGAEPLLDTMMPLLAKIMQRYYRDATVDVAGEVELYLASAGSVPGIPRAKAAFIAKHFAGFLFRKKIVGTLLSEIPGFYVYGDDGWLEMAGRERLRKVRYDKALNEVYATTKVNIDINRVVIRNGFTQRIFDTLASGAFVITSAKPIVEELFVTGGAHREVATFASAEELTEKVRYYLAHEDERVAIAARGREKVLAAHTYDHRVREMFRVVAEQFR